MKLYVKTVDSEESVPDSGYVGIWWIYDNKVIGEYCPVDEGVEDRGYIQFSKTKNHVTEWEIIIKEQLPEAIDLIPNGYRSIERGRVVYNIRSQVYEIICSQAIAADASAIDLIAKEFAIAHTRYDVIPSSHYCVPTLTGNPALDNFDWGD
jgi:hypothetical protein